MTNNINTFYRATLKLLEAVKVISAYAGEPVKQMRDHYKHLPVDYQILEEFAWESYFAYVQLTDDEILDGNIKQVFFSSMALYKRLIRTLMSGFCKEMDRASGAAIYSAIYTSILELIERLAIADTEDRRYYADLVNSYGERLLQFHDICTKEELPGVFCNFFCDELVELNDLYLVYVGRLAK